MSDSLEQPWSNNPNAPQILPEVYIQEKQVFVGYVIGGILYGMLNYVSLRLHSPRCLTYRSRDRRYSILSVYRSID